MTNPQDIQKIASYLKNLRTEEHYSWPLDLDSDLLKGILTNDDLNEIYYLNKFDQQVNIKLLISNKIENALSNQDNRQLMNIFSWIVHEWGKIPKRGDSEGKIFALGLDAIKNGIISFERISSVSKILSFYRPEKYVIYDSRLIYSVNSLLLIENCDSKFFITPSYRNSKLGAFDIEVLIRLYSKLPIYQRNSSKKMIFNADKKIFYPKNVSYERLNQTITNINQLIFEKDKLKSKYPFYTEMLLFAIADTLIYDKIINSISIEINS